MCSEHNKDNMSLVKAIEVKNVSKCYHIYEKPRDRLMQMLSKNKKYYKEFWALRNITFDIQKGETVGIIGRNGSGKSTLLQIICGTLNATEGEVKSHGRIAALLELGSGFNPEFTGDENIYMNGAILGLSRQEMEARYDDIISFADIGDFIHQPVKNYSSGMQVRLAFSVAIHVDPEILVVDEALSVGDAYFQAKCARAIAKIIEKGTTILFVSHDISAVKSLCSRAVLMEHGNIKYFGDVNTAIEKYYSGLVAENNEQPVVTVEDENDDQAAVTVGINVIKDHFNDGKVNFDKIATFQRISQGNAEFYNVQLLNHEGNRREVFDFGETVTLRQILKVNKDLPKISLGYHIRDKNGFDIVYSDTFIENKYEMPELSDLKGGDVFCIDWQFKLNIREGSYVISSMASVPGNPAIGDVQVQDFVPISFTFNVSKGQAFPIYGMVHWDNEVSIKKVTND
ncbi:ABC transporter ATP-binding protein [Phytobacter diazotrophicus]|uniref:ABC transporter ATP-binding protein n=1 Tax=Phytobacter diazotrophicus TaxID=395631 RepID=UPI001CC5F4A5|nr:ABC transporter ATP-binding protein [Phytobacter diazotrophicus]